ncbi:hypothetical protein BH24ACT5_BH24ACT5_21910 [soil metagenome]
MPDLMSIPAPMLTHVPCGSGHPYRIDPDQRTPVQPVVGQAFELRVTAHPTVTAVDVECEGPVVGPTTLTRRDFDDLYADGSSSDAVADTDSATSEAAGHLAAASGARVDIGERVVWTTALMADDAQPFRYRFHWTSGEGPGATDWYDAEAAAWKPDGPSRIVTAGGLAASRLVAADTRWLVGPAGPVRVRFAFELRPEDRVVGFGERFDRLDQRGRALDTVVFEQYKHQGTRTYLPSPFAVITGGPSGQRWGFHVDTSRRVWFDVGRARSDRLVVELDVDPASPAVTVRGYDGDPADVVAQHVATIGPLRRPPDWAFRPWMSGNDWNTQASVIAEVEHSIELGVPVGAIVIEAWSDESTFTAFRDSVAPVRTEGSSLGLADFTFPPDGAWPDPVGIVRRLHELGVKVLLWQIPLVPTDRGDEGQVAADTATMVERGYCVREADGTPYRNRGWWFPGALLPDWTNVDAMAWWLAKRRYLVDEVGIDGFKTDGGEHAWGDELHYADGSRGDESNNLNANRYAAAFTSLLDDCGRDGVTFSRAGWTGAGAAPCHWAGDEDSTWEGLRASITAGLTAGLSGVPFWGWDLAGFSGDIPTIELYVRSAAVAALAPIMQYHSEFDHGRTPRRDRTPWNIAERHDDPRALELYRRFAVLRERLLPYIWAEADVTAATGRPLMQALPVAFPDDPAAWDVPRQYLFGDAVLVAPICDEGVDTIDVYLPAGRWVDAWTGTAVDGPTTVRRHVPWNEIAVYVTAERAAELVPLFAELPTAEFVGG